MDEKIKHEIIARLISIFVVSSFLLIATCIWFGSKDRFSHAMDSGVMAYQLQDLEFVDMSDGIRLENAMPTKDENGMQIDPYVFKVVNHGNQRVRFTLKFIQNEKAIERDQCNVLTNSYLRYTIQAGDDSYTEVSNLSFDGSFYTDELDAGNEKVYQLKFWIDYDAGNEIMGTHFHGLVVIER